MKFATAIATVAVTALGIATFAASPSWAEDVTQTASKVSSSGEEIRPPAGMLPEPGEQQVQMGPAQQSAAKTPAVSRGRNRN